jgi:lipopolysaccharide export system protein LptC
MKTVNWRLVLVIMAMVAMMLLAFYVENTVPVWAR